MRGFIRVVSVVSVILVTLSVITSAQLSNSGSITGVVQDPTGAVVPGASVTLTDVPKNYKYQTTTDASGRYLFRALAASSYALTIQGKGFATAQVDQITLAVNQNLAVDVDLKVGQFSDTVTVSDTGAHVQTEDASTGQVVDRKFINDLPLVGRAVYDLAYLAPGVSQSTGRAYGETSQGNNFVSNGSRNAQADILLDGVSTTNYEQNTGFTLPLYTPTVDNVQEFKIQQTNFSSEFGFSGGTVVNVVTRSGQNQFHGSVYEFWRNNVLNANDFFSERNGNPVPAYRWNNFGGTIGGPIKKDRLFFFFDYEGTRQVTPKTLNLGLPSAAERTGDFGELCGRAGGTFDGSGQCSAAGGQLWDPYVIDGSVGHHVSTQLIPFNNLATYASPNTSNVSWITPSVAGNLVNPVAQNILAFVPLPNISPSQPGYDPFSQNWFGSGSNSNVGNQFDARVDARLTNSDMGGIRVSRGWGNGMLANLFGNDFDANTQGPTKNEVWSGSANYTHTFSPRTLFTATGGYTHSWAHTLGINPEFDPTSIGLPSNLLVSGLAAPPAISVDGYAGENGNANFGGQPWSGLLYGQDVAQIIGSVSHIVGRHELKFGGEWRVHRINFTQFGLPGGRWQFQRGATARDINDGSSGGDAMASFITGWATGWNAHEVPPSPATQNFQYAGFIQDNWRASDRLTLNIGVRYDVDVPRTERFDRMSYFDPSLPSPVTGVSASAGCPACGNLHGSFEYVGDGNPRTPFNTYYGGIGPRFGFAYRVADKTVVRGGYGIYYSPSKGGAAGAGSGGGGFLGFGAQSGWGATSDSDGRTVADRAVLGLNPMPATPGGNAQGIFTSLGSTLNGIPIRTFDTIPREQSWSLGVQREIPWHVVVDAEYIGKRGTHLYLGGATYFLDHLPGDIAEAYRNNPGAFEATVPIPVDLRDAIRANTPAFSNGFWGDTWQAYNGYLPFPQYPNNLWGSSAFQNVDPPVASSIYHGFQLRIEKRFSQGLQLLTTYSMQKSIDDASIAGSNVWVNGTAGASLSRIQDPNNLAAERSLSQFDVSQIFQTSFVYELPFGRGKHWGASMNAIADAIIGNWQFNGIYRWDTGLPILLFLDNGKNLPTYGSQRANLSGALHKADGVNINQYFANPSVASAPAAFFDGNAPRVMPNLRAPGTNNFSASIFKEFPLTVLHEGAKLQFRAEAFNAFNHVQFGAPNSTVGLSSFGQISNQANQPRTMQLALKLNF